MIPNPSLAYEALDYCEANPAKYESLTWIAKFGTATVADFAGRVCLLSGDRPAYEPGHHSTQKVIVGEEVMFVADRAAELLGIDRADASELLYDAASLGEVREAVHRLFGPRPEVRS